jgi:hypothetical protein
MRVSLLEEEIIEPDWADRESLAKSLVLLSAAGSEISGKT